MAQPYIATKPIDFGYVRAYNPGDVVADDVVKEHGLEDSVSRAGSKAAENSAKS